MPALRIIGNGRAGGALSLALEARGWVVRGRLGRTDAVDDAAQGVDLLVISTPDASIADVAVSVRPTDDGTTVVAHLAGSLGLDVLRDAGHPRVAAIHPLVSLPNAELGAERLAAGAWFAVAGDPLAEGVVEVLGGHAFEVADEDRAAYHAAACIASNHTVALLGQVERISASIGVPMDGYLDLVRATIENVAQLGAPAALTGPAARGDWPTIERHRRALSALGADEVATYDAMVRAARRLVDGNPHA
jgi:predicted short-subunit dehydrogenase-like oxidoreductase (DUF2520 family)